MPASAGHDGAYQRIGRVLSVAHGSAVARPWCSVPHHQGRRQPHRCGLLA